MKKYLTPAQIWAKFCGLLAEFQNNEKPIPLYVNCLVMFKADNASLETTIKLNEEVDVDDDDIFFYCNGVTSFKSLMYRDNGEDFIVMDVFSIEGSCCQDCQDSLVNSRLAEIKAEYHEKSLCMGEYLAAESADGLTLEQAFELYIRAKSWADDDVFQVIKDTETFVL